MSTAILKLLLLLALAAGFSSSRVLAQDEELKERREPVTPEILRDKFSEWLTALKDIEREQNLWESDKSILEAGRDGLLAEKETVQDSIKELTEQKEEADRASTELAEKMVSLQEAIDAAEAKLAAYEARALALVKYFPLSLKEQLNDPIVLLSDEEKKKGIGVAARMQNLVTLLTNVEKFNNSVVLDSETRTLADGREQSVDTLYFGLAAAYAVNSTGEYALVGKPGKDGWEFEERPELAAQILRLVEMGRGEGEIEFVDLPAKVK